MRKIGAIAALLIGIVFLSTAEASFIYYGPSAELVNIVEGGSTLLRFPKPVQTVTDAKRFEIQPANPEQPDYALLQIRPIFSKGEAQISFVLSDGSIVRVKARVVPESYENPSSVYDFRPKSELLAKELSGAQSVAINDVDLMKAMIRGHSVSGFKRSDVGKVVQTGMDGVSARLLTVWSSRGRYNGYQFELTNNTNNQEYSVDLRRLKFGAPNQAILSQVDSPRIVGRNRKGEHVTMLRIVAKATSLARDVTLPVLWVKKGDK